MRPTTKSLFLTGRARPTTGGSSAARTEASRPTDTTFRRGYVWVDVHRLPFVAKLLLHPHPDDMTNDWPRTWLNATRSVQPEPPP